MEALAVITGSGWYGSSAGDGKVVATAWGDVEVERRTEGGVVVLAVARHGRAHERLSNQLEPRATIAALQAEGAGAIVATTAVGLLDPATPLGVPILFDDLFFPANRLPDGGLATFFTRPGDSERGHWIPAEPFSPALRALLGRAATEAGLDLVAGGCYVHADGPRFNTAAEHRWMRSVGGIAVSQTCGPEAVLAGELGIPYALVGFGVNHVSGTGAQPTGPGVLEAMLARHGPVVGRLLERLLPLIAQDGLPACDTGGVVRLER